MEVQSDLWTVVSQDRLKGKTKMAKRQGQGVFKEFKLTSLAIDYPTSVLVLMVIVVLSGLGSYAAIPRE